MNDQAIAPKVYHDYKDCIAACLKCATVCYHSAMSAVNEGPQETLSCAPKDLECATICTATAQLMSMGGTYAGRLCKLCAEVCEECAVMSESYKIQHCQECAETCRLCVIECDKLAA